MRIGRKQHSQSVGCNHHVACFASAVTCSPNSSQPSALTVGMESVGKNVSFLTRDGTVLGIGVVQLRTTYSGFVSLT